MSFYQAIADEYDDMTGFEDRLTAAENFLRRITEGRRVRSALDVACGTGLYASAMARIGIPMVAGTDLEPAMLEKAAARVRTQGSIVQWIAADMTELERTLRASFDLILCLGNSLPHLLTQRALEQTLAGFRTMLEPNGMAVIQTLNYDRILDRGERIVSIDRIGKRQFVRFYDFLDNDLVRFNLLRIQWRDNSPVRHDLNSTLLRPYRCAELVQALKACGLRDVQLFGSPALGPFIPDASPTCLVQAFRD